MRDKFPPSLPGVGELLPADDLQETQFIKGACQAALSDHVF